MELSKTTCKKIKQFHKMWTKQQTKKKLTSKESENQNNTISRV
jgi:hypothetical protein